MEHFEYEKQKPVKEKSVYLLHLDAPRIIIICSVVIGIVIVTFLLGMNLSGDKSSSGMTSSENTLLPPGLDDGTFNSLPGESSLLDSSSNPLIMDKEKENMLMPGNERDSVELDKKENSIADSGKDTGDTENILNREVIEQVAPPKKREPEKKSRPQKKSAKVARSEKPKKSTQKKKVVEVSSTHKKPSHKAIPSGQYVIQVASFDKSSKASSEVGRLKRLRFDAFIDRAKVGGKTFYRVRIGPIPSKTRAISMLQNIQDMERYHTSYMVQE
ncbi:MAG: SPOR domain-containing protein [Spirochaetota bacterium]